MPYKDPELWNLFNRRRYAENKREFDEWKERFGNDEILCSRCDGEGGIESDCCCCGQPSSEDCYDCGGEGVDYKTQYQKAVLSDLVLLAEWSNKVILPEFRTDLYPYIDLESRVLRFSLCGEYTLSD